MNLITGITGTVGMALAERLGKVRGMSRNEDAQIQMKKRFPEIEYFVGDVRDYQECSRATKGIDTVYHLAAMKHVGRCEEQPQEAIKTNIWGTMNLVNAAKENKVRRFVLLSTDKAVLPITTYGSTKMIAERIVLNAGYTVIRSGNIMGSSNSIIPILKEQIMKENFVKITDGNMTRFFITLPRLLKYLTDEAIEGLHVPPMKSFRLMDLACKIITKYGNDKTELMITGANVIERQHEYSTPFRCSKDYLTTEFEV